MSEGSSTREIRPTLMNLPATDRFQEVMRMASAEAHKYNHKHIGTEHMLLGLIEEGNGVAVNVFKNLEIDLAQIKLETKKRIQADLEPSLEVTLPRSLEVDKAIECGMAEARGLNHNYFGTEHFLLGVLREGEGIAAQVLVGLGLTADGARQEVLHLIGRGF
jgi:ATP-dependent Clp protease ATP-binding subunit ClpC